MFRFITGCVIVMATSAPTSAAGGSPSLPIPLETYQELAAARLVDVLGSRIAQAPFNLVASLIFLLAICHTFLTAKFRHWAHVAEEAHARKLKRSPS